MEEYEKELHKKNELLSLNDSQINEMQRLLGKVNVFSVTYLEFSFGLVCQ